jgi:ABC-type multidrug transport system fused ATPase/permease subunit
MKKDYKILTLYLVLLVGLISSEPYFYKWLISSIESGKWSLKELAMIIGIWLVVGISTIVTRYAYGMRLMSSAIRDWWDFLMRIMGQMQLLPIEYHRNIQPGEKQKIVDRSAEAIWAVADNLILVFLPQALTFVTLLISGLFIDPFFTLLCIAFLPIGGWIVFYFGQAAYSNQKKANKYWDRLYDRLMDGLVNLSVIRIFARTRHEGSLMRERLDSASEVQYDVRKNWSQFNAFGRFFTIIAKLITISAGAILLYLGRTDFATLFFFIAFTDRIYGPIMEIFGVFQNSMRDIAYYEKAKELMNMTPERDTGTRIFGEIQSGIEFDHVSFSYPSSPRVILSDIHIEIKKWQRIALIWHTGSGKSTITQLLMRFYQPTSGTIRIDGVDIYDYTLESYRSRFAAVFQDTTLFNDTIRHNLEYVRDGITEDDMRRACREANILEFIESLPETWETQVGERGLKLSGGEKQRISIARAILANPEVLILDEATSALDTKTERLVQEAFDHLMEGRTSIIIAHRLSTIVDANEIYLLDGGHILAHGSHSELYRISSEYREMVDMQHDGFVGEDETTEEVK